MQPNKINTLKKKNHKTHKKTKHQRQEVIETTKAESDPQGPWTYG